jgi:N-acetyl-1-D-myo-inositol-2-amino-2-deoxy-alpha-D-glucopyranoside deacetylase
MAKGTFAPKRLLIVHAHPDDESLYTGHIISERLAAGSEVYLLTLTRGERGKVKLDELKPLEGDPLAMASFRSQELFEAIKNYPGLKHSFAGTRAYRDSGVRLNAMGKLAKPRILDDLALSAASPSVIADDILAIMKDLRPDAVLTYNRKGGTGHPDHRMAHNATAMAVRKFSKRARHRAPSFWVIASPGEDFEAEIGNDKTAKVKAAALEAHASQVHLTATGYSVGDGIETKFTEPERIRQASPNPLVAIRPMLTFFWALPLGVLLGLAGTLLHQVRGDGFPLGLVVALVMTGSLALALRLLRSSRGALYLMSAAFAATVFSLAQEQPGGEVLILGNTLGNIWAYGSIGLCALVILFPSIHPSTWRKSAAGHR